MECIFCFTVCVFIVDVEMVQNSTFIHSCSTFVFVFSINICSKFNTYIYIQQFYLFTKLLSIQKLFIHSTTFNSFKIYCASLLVTYFLQRMNRGQWRSASHHWNFKKIPTAFVKRGKAPPIWTWPDYSPTMFYWLFANIFRELQTREKCKEVLHTIRKINGVINPPMGKGVPVLLLSVESLYFKLIFSCVLAPKLDKERMMEGVETMPFPPPPPTNRLKIDLFSCRGPISSKGITKSLILNLNES